MLQLWTVGTHTSSLPQTGLFPPIPTGRVDRPVRRTTATQWRIPTGKRNIGRDLTHTGLYVIDSDHASSLTVIPDIHPENSFASTHRGGSITNLITGHSVQLPTRVADIQNSATGGEITEQAPGGRAYRTDPDSRWGGVSRDGLPTGRATARQTNHKRGSITI